MGLFNFRKSTFKHGVHPPEHKEDTNGLPIRQFPFAPLIILPMAQHIGAPSQIVVREGQEVTRGQLLAKANGFKLILQRTDEPFHFGLMQLYGHVSRDQTPDPILNLHKEAEDNKNDDVEQAAQPPNKQAQHKPK